MNLPNLKLRAFTNDQEQLDKCFYSNFYHLKATKEPESQPIVCDLGSHCGFFTFASLAMGAKKVYAFEPFLDNYRILIENTKESDEKVVSYQLGVYTEYETLFLNYPEIKQGSYYDFSDLDQDINRNGIDCPVLSLDQILALIPETIDVLKINLGYAELDILLKSANLFDSVNNICLETKEEQPKIESFITILKNQGYKDSWTQKNEESGTTLVIIGKDIKKNFNI